MSFRKSLRNSMRLLDKKMYRKGKEKKKKCVCVCVCTKSELVRAYFF